MQSRKHFQQSERASRPLFLVLVSMICVCVRHLFSLERAESPVLWIDVVPRAFLGQGPAAAVALAGPATQGTLLTTHVTSNSLFSRTHAVDVVLLVSVKLPFAHTRVHRHVYLGHASDTACNVVHKRKTNTCPSMEDFPMKAPCCVPSSPAALYPDTRQPSGTLNCRLGLYIHAQTLRQGPR